METGISKKDANIDNLCCKRFNGRLWYQRAAIHTPVFATTFTRAVLYHLGCVSGGLRGSGGTVGEQPFWRETSK
jgi:hypothetical protein